MPRLLSQSAICCILPPASWPSSRRSPLTTRKLCQGYANSVLAISARVETRRPDDIRCDAWRAPKRTGGFRPRLAIRLSNLGHEGLARDATALQPSGRLHLRRILPERRELRRERPLECRPRLAARQIGPQHGVGADDVGVAQNPQ